MSPPRRGTLADLSGVEAVVEAAYRPYVARIGQEPGPLRDDYRRLLDDGLVWLVDDADGVVGVLVLMDAEPDTLLLDNVAVHPRGQARGIGGGLMTFAEAEAVRRGSRRIRLYTHALMIENQAIYARRGYDVTHRARENGLDRIHMAKTLS